MGNMNKATCYTLLSKKNLPITLDNDEKLLPGVP